MNLSTEAHNRIGDVQVKFVIESDETPLGGKTLGSSKGKTNSKDVNEHISVVIAQLVKIDLPDLRKFKCFFDIKWESDYLYAGDGPMISKEVIQEISRFNAGIVFDIYDISDDQASGVNWYSFVGGNPISFTDPTGNFGEATLTGGAVAGPPGAAVGLFVDTVALGLVCYGLHEAIMSDSFDSGVKEYEKFFTELKKDKKKKKNGKKRQRKLQKKHQVASLIGQSRTPHSQKIKIVQKLGPKGF